MFEKNSIKETPEIIEDKLTSKNNKKQLILFNDDFNTFDHVIESLIKICKHSATQAEQCAHIVHFKGKCDIKKGSYNVLKPMKDALILRNLTVSIN